MFGEFMSGTPETKLQAIKATVSQHPNGVALSTIAKDFPGVSRRTLQNRLRRLVDRGRLRRQGVGRGARYFVPEATQMNPAQPSPVSDGLAASIPLSTAAQEICIGLSQPVANRTHVGYDRSFLDNYHPNQTFYLSKVQRTHLLAKGKSDMQWATAGTYARNILGRLLIDLSWNSSRLEGNTYSLLETQRLIERGLVAEEKDSRETAMIQNHKTAIEFLVEYAGETGFKPRTILNLHATLSDGLLPDPQAEGRLRHIPVGIAGSVFTPLVGPQIIEECFHSLLSKVASIEDPFEQALFVLVQLPYLQPFDDVNKRVSRLACNIPFITANLSPISFIDVPQELYVQGTFGVYETKRIELLREVFIWAYERSARNYAAQRQSLGQPDAFRLRHRQHLQTLVNKIIRERLTNQTAAKTIRRWATENVSANEQEQFVMLAERELLGVGDNNFARYRVRLSEYYAWRQAREENG